MPSQDTNSLSDRELDILRLVATGASNKEIAQQLYISSNTVKVHLRNIFTKIGAASRTEAAMYAVRIGLVETAPGKPPIEESSLDSQSTTEESHSVPGSISVIQVEDTRIKRPRIPLWVGLVVLFAIFSLAGITFVLARDLSTQVTPTIIYTPTAPPSPTPIPRWHELDAMPTARSSLAVVAFENKIYAIGGQTASGVTSASECYDIETNAWIELAEKPTAVSEINAAVIGGLIYVPGGRLETGLTTDIFEVYDPVSNEWGIRAAMPSRLSGYSLVTHEGHLFIFGGWDGQEYRNNVYEYNPASDTWAERSPMPTARAFSGAAVAGGVIYVIGGYDGNRSLTVNEVYIPSREGSQESAWEQVSPLPSGRYAMGAASVADLVYLVGGKGESDEPLTPVEYSPFNDSWQTFSMPIPESWSALGMVSFGQYLYVLGGMVQNSHTSLHLSYQAIYTIMLPLIP